MKEQDELAAELAALDFTDCSSVKDSLKERLLITVGERAKRGPITTKEMIMHALVRRKLAVVTATVLAVAAISVQLLWPGALPAAAQNVGRFINRVVLGRATVSEVTPRCVAKAVAGPVTTEAPVVQEVPKAPVGAGMAPDPRPLPWKTVINAVPMRHTTIAQVPAEDMTLPSVEGVTNTVFGVKNVENAETGEVDEVTYGESASCCRAETVVRDGQEKSVCYGPNGEELPPPALETPIDVEKYDAFEEARTAVTEFLDLREPGYLPEDVEFVCAFVWRRPGLPYASLLYCHHTAPQVGWSVSLDEHPAGYWPENLKTALQTKQVYINGEIGCLIDVPVGDLTCKMLKWEDESTSYSLSSITLPESELLKIAESLTY